MASWWWVYSRGGVHTSIFRCCLAFVIHTPLSNESTSKNLNKCIRGENSSIFSLNCDLVRWTSEGGEEVSFGRNSGHCHRTMPSALCQLGFGQRARWIGESLWKLSAVSSISCVSVSRVMNCGGNDGHAEIFGRLYCTFGLVADRLMIEDLWWIVTGS